MKVFCLLFFKKVGVFKSYFTSFYKEIKDYETRHKSFGSAFSKADGVKGFLLTFFQKAKPPFLLKSRIISSFNPRYSRLSS